MRALVILKNPDFVFPEPSTYLPNTATIVNSARNTNGVTIGAVIRTNVAKIDMTFNWITPQKWASILQQFEDEYGGSFYRDVSFLNQVSNKWETRKMYVSDRNAEGALRWNDDGTFKGYKNARIALIEV